MRTILYMVLAFCFWFATGAASAQGRYPEPRLVDSSAEQGGVEGRIYAAQSLSRYDRMLEIANEGVTDPSREVTAAQFDGANSCWINYVCTVRGVRSPRRNGNCDSDPATPPVTWESSLENCHERGGVLRRELIAGHAYFVPMSRRETATEIVRDATGVLQALAGEEAPDVRRVDAELARLIQAGQSDDAPPDFRASVPAFEAVRSILPHLPTAGRTAGETTGVPPVPRTGGTVSAREAHGSSDPSETPPTGGDHGETSHSSVDAEPNPFLHPIAIFLYGFAAGAILLALIFWAFVYRRMRDKIVSAELNAAETVGIYTRRLEEFARVLKIEVSYLKDANLEMWQKFLAKVSTIMASKTAFETERTQLATAAETELKLIHGFMQDADNTLDVKNMVQVKGFFARLKELSAMVRVWPADWGQLSAAKLEDLVNWRSGIEKEWNESWNSDADTSKHVGRLLPGTIRKLKDDHDQSLIDAQVEGNQAGWDGAKAHYEPLASQAKAEAEAAKTLMDEVNSAFEAFKKTARDLATELSNEFSMAGLHQLFAHVAPELVPAPALAFAGAPGAGPAEAAAAEDPFGEPRRLTTPPPPPSGDESDSVVAALQAGVVPGPTGALDPEANAPRNEPEPTAEASSEAAAEDIGSEEEDELAGEPTQIGTAPKRPRKQTGSYAREDVEADLAAARAGNGNGASPDGTGHEPEPEGEPAGHGVEFPRPRTKTLPVFGRAPDGELEPAPAPSDPPPPGSAE